MRSTVSYLIASVYVWFQVIKEYQHTHFYLVYFFILPDKSRTMISNMTIEMERKRSCGSCLRYCMIVVNIVFAVSGCHCFLICQMHVITSAEEGGYVFGAVCLSVCLFVCLSVGLLANL